MDYEMILHKHIYYDALMIEDIKKGLYPEWEVVFEDGLIIKLRKSKG